MIDKTLKERGDRYGSFETGAEIMQSLKSVAAQHNNWVKIPAYQREAIEMIFHKIGRAINGDSNYIDNWHDIQGFAKLVEDVLSEKQRIESGGDENIKYHPSAELPSSAINCRCELRGNRLQADLLEAYRAKKSDKIERKYLISELEKIEINKSFSKTVNSIKLDIRTTFKNGVTFCKHLDVEMCLYDLKGHLTINRVNEIVKRMNDEIKSCNSAERVYLHSDKQEMFKNTVNSANERYLALERELDQIIDKQNATKNS